MFRELVLDAAAIAPTLWDELEETAEQVAALSMLPVVGAGASRPCDAPLARDLARDLQAKVKAAELTKKKK